MEQRYLIDTNVISHLFADKLPPDGKAFVSTVINVEFIISVVVEIEVLTYHDLPNKMQLIEEFISLATILPLNNEVTKKAIELRRKYRKLALADAIIAATTLVNQLVLITNNEKDFLNIKGLKVLNPYSL
jgi:predicted nucleic acid-binding protein